MNPRILSTSLLALTLASLGACSHDVASPVIATPLLDGQQMALATTSDRRIWAISKNGKICGEAPSGVAENLAANSAVKAQAAAGATGASSSGTLNVTNNDATAVQAVAKKSQGIMYLETATTAVCYAYLSDNLNVKDYLYAINQAAIVAANLIVLELQVTGGKIGPDTVIPQPVSNPKPSETPAPTPTPTEALAPMTNAKPLSNDFAAKALENIQSILSVPAGQPIAAPQPAEPPSSPPVR